MNNYETYPENDYRLYLQHATKGKTWTWKDHKYIDVINGRYIYPAKKAVSNAISSVTSGQVVRDIVGVVKGTYRAAKAGGLSNARDYLKSRIRQRKNNKLFAENSASSDYAESDRINRRALNKAAKKKEKELRREQRKDEKRKKAVQKEFPSLKSLGNEKLRNKQLNKARKDISKLREKYLNNKYDRSLKTRTMNLLLSSKLGKSIDTKRQQKRAESQRSEARSKLPTEEQRKQTLAKARRDINNKYYAINNTTQMKEAMKSASSTLKTAYKNVEKAYNDDTLRDAIKSASRKLGDSASKKLHDILSVDATNQERLKQEALDVLKEEARNQERLKEELKKKNKNSYNIDVHSAS